MTLPPLVQFCQTTEAWARLVSNYTCILTVAYIEHYISKLGMKVISFLWLLTMYVKLSKRNKVLVHQYFVSALLMSQFAMLRQSTTMALEVVQGRIKPFKTKN